MKKRVEFEVVLEHDTLAGMVGVSSERQLQILQRMNTIFGENVVDRYGNYPGVLKAVFSEFSGGDVVVALAVFSSFMAVAAFKRKLG